MRCNGTYTNPIQIEDWKHLSFPVVGPTDDERDRGGDDIEQDEQENE